MARRVWKVTVPVDDKVHSFTLPAPIKWLSVGCQDRIDEVQAWVEIDDSGGPLTVHLVVVGTGHDLEQWEGGTWRAVHVGTTIAVRAGDPLRHLTTRASTSLVWHLYELIEIPEPRSS